MLQVNWLAIYSCNGQLPSREMRQPQTDPAAPTRIDFQHLVKHGQLTANKVKPIVSSKANLRSSSRAFMWTLQQSSCGALPL